MMISETVLNIGFSHVKVRNHCYTIGEYRGSAYTDFNIQGKS